jgi:hypothetical protein
MLIQIMSVNCFILMVLVGQVKQYFYNNVLPEITKKVDNAIALASSGIASLLLEKRGTANFKLKIALKCTKIYTK